LNGRVAFGLLVTLHATTRGFGKIVIAEQIEEVIALLDKAVALVNEAMTASPERQVEIRMKFDGIMREIDKIRLSNQN
jgi:hypothetical protein